MIAVRTLFLCFCFALVLLALQSCYKQPLLPYIEHKVLVDSISKSYFASYHIGSQWIYQKEGSVILDTVVESSFDNEYYEFGGDPLDVQNTHYVYQNLTISYNSQVSGNLNTSISKYESDTNNTYCAFVGENVARESAGIFYRMYPVNGPVTADRKGIV